MNAPLVWILLPGIAAVLLLLVHRMEKLVTLLAVSVALSLAWIAWRIPIGQAVALGPWSFRIAANLTVLGRQFVLAEGDRPTLVLIYLAAAFWLGGATVTRAGRVFVPAALGIVAILTAALAVTPFLYAALLIEMAALLSVPILSSPGQGIGRGVLRFLIFQTLGMPFILFTGWKLTGLETSPGDVELALQASLLMGLGFSFLLAIFPFHTWLPMLMEEAHPYAAAFVFLMLPGMVSFLGLGFLDSYAWLRSTTEVFTLLQVAGALMVAAGGFWAAFQRNLGRMLGYAVMVEIGFSLLSISLHGSPSTLGFFFALLLPRGLALGVWAMALSLIRSQGSSLDFRSVQGFARRLPLASAAIVLAHFSLVGFPLLAGFPVRLALWEGLASQSPQIALWSLLGSVLLMAGGLRTLAVLVMGAEGEGAESAPSPSVLSPASTSSGARLLLGLGLLGLFLVGLFPQWFLPTLARVPPAFQHLIP